MRHRMPASRNSKGRSRFRFCPAVEQLESRVVFSVNIAVDATANQHAINPLIYGSAFATTAQLADLNLAINREGGNASDTYNWQVDATNHASDWYYESIAGGTGNGQSMDAFVSQTKAGGGLWAGSDRADHALRGQPGRRQRGPGQLSGFP